MKRLFALLALLSASAFADVALTPKPGTWVLVYPGSPAQGYATQQACYDAGKAKAEAAKASSTFTCSAFDSVAAKYTAPAVVKPTVAPSGLAVAAGNGQATVTWQALAGASSYQVYVNSANNPAADVPGTSHTLAGLTNGTVYSIRIGARNSAGYGPWSAAVSVTPAGPVVVVPPVVIQPGTVTATFTPTDMEIANPERGVSRGFNELQPQQDFNAHFAAGYRIVTIRPNLTRYVNAPFDAAVLTMLDTMASRVRAAGLKLAIGMSYENCGSDIVGMWGCGPVTWANGHPTLTRILGHIAQLQPWFRANADILVAVHAGFIGGYGEWGGPGVNVGNPNNNPSPTLYYYEPVQGLWDSTDAAKLAVKDALLAAMDPRTPLAIRNFPAIMKWHPTPLTAAQAFTGSPQSRIHHHSDCFMANKDDAGTYWVPGARWNGQYVDTGVTLANPFRAYHAAAAPWMSTGGEPCGGNERLGCGEILRDGPRYHWRYLRDDWGTDLWASWASGGCLAEVKRSFGYRYELKSVSHPGIVASGAVVNVTIDLRNVGWSRMFNERKIVVTLRNRATGALATGSAGDMRKLGARESLVVSVPVTAPGPGDHDVLISMPDIFPKTAGDVRQAVRFANADSGAQAWLPSTAQMRSSTILRVQ